MINVFRNVFFKKNIHWNFYMKLMNLKTCRRNNNYKKNRPFLNLFNPKLEN